MNKRWQKKFWSSSSKLIKQQWFSKRRTSKNNNISAPKKWSQRLNDFSAFGPLRCVFKWAQREQLGVQYLAQGHVETKPGGVGDRTGGLLIPTWPPCLRFCATAFSNLQAFGERLQLLWSFVCSNTNKHILSLIWMVEYLATVPQIGKQHVF